MKYSSQSKHFAYYLVQTHATFESSSKSYVLDISDIPDFNICKLVSFIMSEDDSYAAESTGPDNDGYEKAMLPKLIQLLNDISNQDNVIEFVNTWIEGVSSYFSIEDLLDEQLSEYNYSHGYTKAA